MPPAASSSQQSRQVRRLAELITSARHVVFCTGAGVSTNAGIRDYRGPNGIWTEAAALGTLGLDAALPVMKSLGLQQLLTHLKGRIGLEEAAAAAKQSTRRFAKRQQTWFRNQIEPNLCVSSQFSERFCDEIFPKICEFLLTAQN